MHTSHFLTTAASPREIVTGRRLTKRLRQGTSPEHLAYDLQAGSLWLIKLTRQQARLLTGTAATVRRGRQPARNGNGRLLYRRNLSGDEVYHLVAELGPSRVLEALDRLTRPAVAAE
jgi:hypothetical protein